MVAHKKQIVYLIRHAEATHNIKEREAVQRAIENGAKENKAEQEKARRAVLEDESLKDAPLSPDGKSQAKLASSHLSALHKAGLSKYPAPQLILVSPLRRALMTAAELFLDQATAGGASHSNHPPPKCVAMEALREKRTGFAADERSSVDVLEKEFPHVDFSDLREQRTVVPKGEDNGAVRARARAFLEGLGASLQQDSIALVTHKGWLRELRHALKEYVNEGSLTVNFDLENWDQTLYQNAEIRVAEFFWEDSKLTSIVSKSIENALGTVVQDARNGLLEKSMK